MGKNFTAVFAVCLAISALPLACGDDEDDDGNGDGGKGGKGGSSGSTNGGTAGGGKGGTSGSGGTTGGTAGKGGTSGTGGTTGGSAGTGGTMGGEGGMGGAEGGMGGEGGQVEPPQSLCEQVCAGPPGACVTDCETTGYCASFLTTTDCADDTEAVLTCFAGDLGAASWACTQGVPQYNGDDCYDLFAAAYAAGCVVP